MLKVDTSGGKFDITFSEDKSEGKSKVKYDIKSGTSRPPQHGKQHSSLSKGPQSLGKAGIKDNRKPRSTGKSLRKGNLGNSSDVQGRSTKSRLARGSSEVISKSSSLSEAGYLSEAQLARILAYTKEDLHILKEEELDKSVVLHGLSSTTTGSRTTEQEEQKGAALMNSESGWNVNQPYRHIGNATTVSSTTSNVDTSVPMALRSSFAVGAPGLVVQETQNKSENVKKWRQELDMQIREKKERELREKKTQKNTSPHSSTDIHAMSRPVGNFVQSDTALHQSPRAVQVTTVSSTSSNVDTSVPMALRSSFAVGAPGLVVQETQTKSENVKKWRQELDMQIREKKERQSIEKKTQKDVLAKSWGRPRDVYRSPPRPSPEVASHTQAPAMQSSVITQSEAAVVHGMAEDNSSNFPRHARGHGMQSLDLQNQEEMERKRAKMLEHQRAIQEQVEERRRKKREEQNEKWKEEAAEEAKLAREHDFIQKRFEEEQRRKKDKEEESKRRGEVLRLSVLQAHEAAQQANNEKRLKHLQSAGHDVSLLKSRMEASSASYVIPEEPRTIVPTSSTTPLNIDVDQKDESPRYDEIFTSRTDTDRSIGSLPHRGGIVRTKYDEHSLYKVNSDSPRADVLASEPEQSSSPPVPGLRNRKTDRSPKQQTKGAVSKTTNSRSDKGIKNKTAMLPSKQRKPVKSEMSREHNPTLREQESSIGRHSEYFSPPPSPLVDAFMVPYHRTTSATLHQMPDSSNRASETSNKQSEHNPTDLLPLYRTESLTLKDGEKTNLSPKQQRPAPKTKKRQTGGEKVGSPQNVKAGSLTRKENVSSSAHKMNQQDAKRKSDPAHSGSIAQDIEEVIRPTSRQEMILQQLATLRRGLMLKERELQQGVL